MGIQCWFSFHDPAVRESIEKAALDSLQEDVIRCGRR
jgi:hypothetical protein